MGDEYEAEMGRLSRRRVVEVSDLESDLREADQQIEHWRGERRRILARLAKLAPGVDYGGGEMGEGGE